MYLNGIKLGHTLTGPCVWCCVYIYLDIFLTLSLPSLFQARICRDEERKHKRIEAVTCIAVSRANWSRAILTEILRSCLCYKLQELHDSFFHNIYKR